MQPALAPRPLVAVVVPAYNGAETLKECLECLAEQTCEDIRVIVLENCSTDATPDIARSFVERDNRFSMVSNETHLQPLDNFYKAIEIGVAEADYFCLRACDDYTSPDYLELLQKALQDNPEKLLAVGDVLSVSSEATKPKGANPSVFDFPESYVNGRVPRNLTFPSEWFYGLFRASAKDRLLGRWHEKPNPWAFASYIMYEFIVLDLFVYVPGPTFRFTYTERSKELVGETSVRNMLRERLNYTFGTYALHKALPKASVFSRMMLFRMCWNDARRKTRYRIFGFV